MRVRRTVFAFDRRNWRAHVFFFRHSVTAPIHRYRVAVVDVCCASVTVSICIGYVLKRRRKRWPRVIITIARRRPTNVWKPYFSGPGKRLKRTDSQEEAALVIQKREFSLLPGLDRRKSVSSNLCRKRPKGCWVGDGGGRLSRRLLIAFKRIEFVSPTPAGTI